MVVGLYTAIGRRLPIGRCCSGSLLLAAYCWLGCARPSESANGSFEAEAGNSRAAAIAGRASSGVGPDGAGPDGGGPYRAELGGAGAGGTTARPPRDEAQAPESPLRDDGKAGSRSAGVGGGVGADAGHATADSALEAAVAELGDVADGVDRWELTCTAPLVPQVGGFDNIYDPSVGEQDSWYINDHTIVRGPDGLWHMFGITHTEPARPLEETQLAHATSPSLTASGWQKQPPALVADPAHGETLLWAPYVLAHEDTYYMFYCGGGEDETRYQISLATSSDLWHWTREPAPLFYDGYQARDPFVLRIGDQWVMYYKATLKPDGGEHVVAYRTSSDLRRWSGRRIAYRDRETGTIGGATESPFVVAQGGRYFLLIGPRNAYSSTGVFHSADPFQFGDPQIAELPAHAPEVITDLDGTMYVSRAGWGERGLWLAPLGWAEHRCETFETDFYRVEIEIAPSAGIASLVLPSTERELISIGTHGARPYLAMEDFAISHPLGPPRSVGRSPDGSRLLLRALQVGDEPVEADWEFCFSSEWFDHRITWHVTGQTTEPVWEVGWLLVSSLAGMSDALDSELWTDLAGFGPWTVASDPTATLAVAYLPGSAWAEDNRWLVPTVFSWQNLRDPGGGTWPQGTYAGGVWRVALSSKGDDLEFAERVAGEMGSGDSPCVTTEVP